MKFNILTTTAVVLTYMLASCDLVNESVRPSDDISSRNEDFSNYDRVEASHAFEVFVDFSDTEEYIEIEANDNLHEYIEVYKMNNTLHIGIKNNISIRGSATLRAYITTNSISSFSGSGASRFVLHDPVETDYATIDLSGASNLSGELYVQDLLVDLSGASHMNIQGDADMLDIELSGASVFKDYNFSTAELKADLSGASHMQVSVTEKIDIEASGASNLKYHGSPQIIRQEVSGASHVNKTN